jgi:hypothetical protein
MSAVLPIEVLFTAALAVVALAFAWVCDLPFVVPSLGGAGFAGIHYLVPLSMAVIWALCASRGGRRRIGVLAVPFVCYAMVLWLHFNLKLWVPLLDIPYHDDVLRRTDLVFGGVVAAAFRARIFLARFLPAIDHLYMGLFMGLFYVGFCVHALRSQRRFRKVFLAALFLQGLGGLAYLVYPAIGPFVVEPGLNPVAAAVQEHMLTVTRAIDGGGTEWLRHADGSVLFTGLGAMPSLHAGGAFLFLWFAWKWERPLLIFYVPVFLFILLGAIATRWHYLVDLPVGIALAGVSIFLAFRLDGVELRLVRWSRPTGEQDGSEALVAAD